MNHGNETEELPDLMDVEPKSLNIPQFSKSECCYTKQYCEENVYLLCKKFLEEYPDLPSYAVFISNPTRTVAVWQQALEGYDENTPVVWDYHVVLFVECGQRPYIYDLDTRLPFPCEASYYAAQSFHPQGLIRPQFRQKFRVIPAKDFVEGFASDRTHMKVASTNKWLAVPPSYPCIKGVKATENMNLDAWICTDPDNNNQTTNKGVVVTLQDFIMLCETGNFMSL